jgi:hypothetical protein
MTSVTARRVHVKSCCSLVLAPSMALGWTATGPLAALPYLKAGLAIWNHHSVHPSSLSRFPLKPTSLQAFLVPPPTKDGRSLG